MNAVCVCAYVNECECTYVCMHVCMQNAMSALRDDIERYVCCLCVCTYVNECECTYVCMQNELCLVRIHNDMRTYILKGKKT